MQKEWCFGTLQDNYLKFTSKFKKTNKFMKYNVFFFFAVLYHRDEAMWSGVVLLSIEFELNIFCKTFLELINSDEDIEWHEDVMVKFHLSQAC